MSKLPLLLFVMLTVVSSKAQAFGASTHSKEAQPQDSCSTIDLNNQTLGPPLNTDGIGWCFAYAASDAFTQALGIRVSPTSIGVNVVDHHGWLEKDIRKLFLGNFWDGETMTAVVNYTASGGLCRLGDENFDPFAVKAEYVAYGHIQREGRGVCKEPLPRYRPSYTIGGPVTVDGSQEDTLPMIDGALESGRLPMIEYSADFIVSGIASDLDLHISTVVGRQRTADGSCEYQVRNVWGPYCYREYKPVVRCDGGNYWISSENLQKMVQSVLTIDSLTRR
jgi:hypothetical protein